MDKIWTKEEIETHIKANVTDYGAAIVVAALFKKLYGVYPKIGLSGFQGEAVESVVKVLPHSLEETP
jgi:hypothetical protein